MASTYLHSSGSISTLGSTKSGFIGILTYQSMSAFFLWLGRSTASGSLGLDALNHLWTCQVSYVFPCPALVPLHLSKFLVEPVTDEFRFLFKLHLVDGGSLAYHSSQHV